MGGSCFGNRKTKVITDIKDNEEKPNSEEEKDNKKEILKETKPESTKQKKQDSGKTINPEIAKDNKQTVTSDKIKKDGVGRYVPGITDTNKKIEVIDEKKISQNDIKLCESPINNKDANVNSATKNSTNKSVAGNPFNPIQFNFNKKQPSPSEKKEEIKQRQVLPPIDKREEINIDKYLQMVEQIDSKKNNK